jgi:hypothetical protein
MRLRTSVAAVGIAAVLGFTLAGCFSTSSPPPTEEESAPPAISAEPATGELITGTGYSLNAPEGWAVPPDAPPSADIFVVAEEADAAGFIDSVNVLLGRASGEPLTAIETNGVAYLEGVGGTEVQVRPRVTVAGTESAHLSAQLSRSGISYWTEQYLVIEAGIAYTVTFSFGETVSLEDREALAESVLATWTWA